MSVRYVDNCGSLGGKQVIEPQIEEEVFSVPGWLYYLASSSSCDYSVNGDCAVMNFTRILIGSFVSVFLSVRLSVLHCAQLKFHCQTRHNARKYIFCHDLE